MSVIKSITVFFCRRRTLTSRLLPVILQLLLIIIIWWIFKCHVSSSVGKKNVSDEDSLPHSDQTQSLPAGFSRTKTLKVLDVTSLLSYSRTIELSGELNQARTLGVDVYVHDAEKGTIVLYPAGTPINFEDKSTKEMSENKDDVQYEYTDKNLLGDDDLANAYDNYDENAEKVQHTLNNSAELYRTERSKELLVNNINGHAQFEKTDNQLLVDNPANSEYSEDNPGNIEYSEDNPGNSEYSEDNPEDNEYREDSPADHEYRENVVIGSQNSGAADKMLFENQISKSRIREQHTLDHRFDQIPSYGQDEVSNDNPVQLMQELELQENTGVQMLNNITPTLYLFQNPITSNQNLKQMVSRGYGQQEREVSGFQPLSFENLPKNVLKSQSNQMNYARSHTSSGVAQLEASGSTVKSMAPLNKDIDPILTEGFLDRANKLILELHGKIMDNFDFKNSKSSNLLLMNNPQACQNLGEIDLLYLINSKPQSSDMRQRIRDTFVNSTYFKPSVIVHIFLVGKTTSPTFQQNFHREQDLYGDIVQGDFIDVPENATDKGLMGMRWMTQFCPQAKYVMTINEDVFVDTDKLIHGLIPAARKVASRRIMLCYFNPESPIPRTGPVSFNENVFPERINLRPYCKSFAILMTREVIFSLLAASAHMPPFRMDDLYLYGFLPFIAGGIDVFDMGNKRAFNNFGIETVNCYKQALDQCPFVATVAFSDRFTTLWDFVKTRIQTPHQDWKDDRSLWNLESFLRKF